jgi:hypothetical protein
MAKCLFGFDVLEADFEVEILSHATGKVCVGGQPRLVVLVV